MKKKLYKSNIDKKLCGVCGGIAEYFNIDSTIVRLIWVFLFFAYGTGLLAYLVCAIVIPDNNVVAEVKKENNNAKESK